MSLFEKFFRLGRTTPPVASISALRLDGPAAQFSTDGTLVEMNRAFATLMGAASAQDVTRGEEVFQHYCAACHRHDRRPWHRP